MGCSRHFKQGEDNVQKHGVAFAHFGMILYVSCLLYRVQK